MQSLLFLLYYSTVTSRLSNIDDEKVFILLLLIGIGTSWAYFIRTILQSHFRTPSIIEKNYKHYYRPKSNSNTGSNNDSLLPSPNATPSADLPLVSIIIPARNGQDNIEKCLSSLVSQSYQNTEIIVVDDNSDDQTLAIMERWQSVKVPFLQRAYLL